MRVKLLKRQKIEGEAGTIVEVDPVRASFLIAYGAAEPAEIREQIETPEKRAEVKKTTRKAKGSK